jgi:hypothetical protein
MNLDAIGKIKDVETTAVGIGMPPSNNSTRRLPVRRLGSVLISVILCAVSVFSVTLW